MYEVPRLSASRKIQILQAKWNQLQAMTVQGTAKEEDGAILFNVRATQNPLDKVAQLLLADTGVSTEASKTAGQFHVKLTGEAAELYNEFAAEFAKHAQVAAR